MESELVNGVHKEYLARNITKLVIIRESVQILPQGPFTHRDLRWCRVAAGDKASRTTHPVGESRPANEADERVKYVAYIAWTRVMDFKEGEERGRKDIETVFRRTKKETRNRGDIKKVRWNVLIDYWR